MNSKLSFSFISWIITIVIAIAVILPIYTQIGEAYQFYIPNILFILIFLTFTRFIFLTKFHWFSHLTWAKMIMIFGVIPILLYVVGQIWDFQRFMDEEGITSIMTEIHADSQRSLAKYLKAEMTFFWAGAFISSIALPLRMIHSIWRLQHRGKV